MDTSAQKKVEKKELATFKLQPEIDVALTLVKQETGLTRTFLVEDALRYYWGLAGAAGSERQSNVGHAIRRILKQGGSAAEILRQIQKGRTTTALLCACGLPLQVLRYFLGLRLRAIPW